jgi:hypothetical protein
MWMSRLPIFADRAIRWDSPGAVYPPGVYSPVMPARPRNLRIALITFALGGVLLVAGVSVALTRAPPRVLLVEPAGIKAISAEGASIIGLTTRDATVCQAGETLPAATDAVRVSVWAFLGSHVQVTAYRGSRVLTRGARNGAWTSDSVTVPVAPLRRTVSGVQLCFTFAPNSQPLMLLGPRSPPQLASAIVEAGAEGPERHLLRGHVSVEYLSPGSGSWWSRLSTLVRNAGFGRAFSGSWIALLIAALTLGAGALAVRLTLRELP